MTSNAGSTAFWVILSSCLHWIEVACTAHTIGVYDDDVLGYIVSHCKRRLHIREQKGPPSLVDLHTVTRPCRPHQKNFQSLNGHAINLPKTSKYSLRKSVVADDCLHPQIDQLSRPQPMSSDPAAYKRHKVSDVSMPMTVNAAGKK